MSLGQGAVYAKSVKQKLNTWSSTESELVGVHDMLQQIMWTNSFWNAKDTTNKIHILLKIMRVQYCSRKMEECQVARGQNTSPCGVFLCKG